MTTSGKTTTTTTSLTAPWDREPPLNIIPGIPPLTDEELKYASNELVDQSLVALFPRIERVYKDPPLPGQTYCMHSFVPSKGATPDEKGVYGFVKCRGCFSTLEESQVVADNIIKNYDSIHRIYTSKTGEPFPVFVPGTCKASEEKLVDIRKHAVKTISEDIRQKQLDEKKEMDEIRQREKKLMDDSNAAQKDQYTENPLEVYITKHVKRANLVFAYVQGRKKLQDMQASIRNVYKEIRDMDSVHPDFAARYYDRYIEARKAAHVPVDDPKKDDNWMRYLCEDADLDFDVFEEEKKEDP